MRSFSKTSHSAAGGSRRQLHSQGSLDGMCGPYAIANALELCGVRRADEIIQAACSAVSPKRWPDIYWRGTSLRDLQRMLLACRHALGIEQVVKAEYPFRSRPARTEKQFWRKFDSAFQEPTTVCAIIGITWPAYHWLVVRKEGRRIVFVDSAPRSTLYRKNRSALVVGIRRSKKLRSAWVIDSQDFIVLRTIRSKTRRGKHPALRRANENAHSTISAGNTFDPDLLPKRVKRRMSELVS